MHLLPLKNHSFPFTKREMLTLTASRIICGVAFSRFKSMGEKYNAKLDSADKIISEILFTVVEHHAAKWVGAYLARYLFASNAITEKAQLLDTSESYKQHHSSLTYYDSILHAFLSVAGHQSLDLKNDREKIAFEAGLSCFTSLLYLLFAYIESKALIEDETTFLLDFEKAITESQDKKDLSDDLLKITRGDLKKVFNKMKVLHPKIYENALEILKKALDESLDKTLHRPFLPKGIEKHLSEFFYSIDEEACEAYFSTWLTKSSPDEATLKKKLHILKPLLKSPPDLSHLFESTPSKAFLTIDEKKNAYIWAKISAHNKSIADELKKQLDTVSDKKKTLHINDYVDFWGEKLIEKLLLKPSAFCVEKILRPLLKELNGTVDPTNLTTHYIEALKKEYISTPPKSLKEDLLPLSSQGIFSKPSEEYKRVKSELTDFFVEQLSEMDKNEQFLSYKKYIAIVKVLYIEDPDKLKKYSANNEKKPLLDLYQSGVLKLSDSQPIFDYDTHFKVSNKKEFSSTTLQQAVTVAIPTLLNFGLYYLLLTKVFSHKKCLKALGMANVPTTQDEKIKHTFKKLFIESLTSIISYTLTKELILPLAAKVLPSINHILELEKKENELKRLKSIICGEKKENNLIVHVLSFLVHFAPIFFQVELSKKNVHITTKNLLIPRLLGMALLFTTYVRDTVKDVTSNSVNGLLKTNFLSDGSSKHKEFQTYFKTSLGEEGIKQLKASALNEPIDKALFYTAMRILPDDQELFECYLKVIDESSADKLTELDIAFFQAPPKGPLRDVLKNKVRQSLKEDKHSLFMLVDKDPNVFHEIIVELVQEENDKAIFGNLKKIDKLKGIVASIIEGEREIQGHIDFLNSKKTNIDSLN